MALALVTCCKQFNNSSYGYQHVGLGACAFNAILCFKSSCIRLLFSLKESYHLEEDKKQCDMNLAYMLPAAEYLREVFAILSEA